MTGTGRRVTAGAAGALAVRAFVAGAQVFPLAWLARLSVAVMVLVALPVNVTLTGADPNLEQIAVSWWLICLVAMASVAAEVGWHGASGWLSLALYVSVAVYIAAPVLCWLPVCAIDLSRRREVGE